MKNIYFVRFTDFAPNILSNETWRKGLSHDAV